MEAAKEAYIREQLALERIDLDALRRRAAEFVRPGLQELVYLSQVSIPAYARTVCV